MLDTVFTPAPPCKTAWSIRWAQRTVVVLSPVFCPFPECIFLLSNNSL